MRLLRRYTPRNDISLLLLLFFLSSCATTGLKVGRTKTGEVVEVEASCPVVNEDASGAQNCSLAEAQKQALGKVLGVFISAKTRVAKAVAIQDNILAKTQGYISKYEILKQKRDGDSFKTKIRALIAFEKLGADLSELDIIRSPEIGNPKVSVNLGDQTANAALAKVLREKGFNVVKGGEDIAIVGNAATFPVVIADMSLGGLSSQRATLTAQALRGANKETLDAVTLQLSAADITADAASKKALTLIGEKAGASLAQSLPKKLLERQTLNITLANVKNLETLENCQKVLYDIASIDNFYLRSYKDQTAQIEAALVSQHDAIFNLVKFLSERLKASIVKFEGNAATLSLP